MGKKILFLATHFISLYSTRRELIQELCEQGYDVYLSLPESDDNKFFTDLGCKILPIKVDRRGTNPFKDIFVILNYFKTIRKLKPDIILSYEIKPNIYGGVATFGCKIPQLANITGLGTAIEDGGILSKLVVLFYRFAFGRVRTVFVQNESNLEFCRKNKIVKENYILIPGSGVNLAQHCFEEYPSSDDKTIFLIIGRVMKSKGADEILEAAEYIKSRYDNVIFRFIGFCEDEEYQMKVSSAVYKGIVEYYGNQTDVHPFIKESHATILPSYHEGMSNVLLETAATGRPVLASDIPGCRETFDPYVSGIPFEPKDSKDLIRAIEEFIAMSHDKRKAMGIAGRKKVEEQFDRQIVVNKYIEVIEKEVN